MAGHGNKHIWFLSIAACAIFIMTLACSTVSNALPANATSTAGVAATQAAVARISTEQAVQTVDAMATQTAAASQTEQAGLITLAAATDQANQQATGTAQLTATVSARETRSALERRGHTTETVAARRSATHVAAAQKTAQSANFQKVIQQLHDDGVIGTSEGEYKRLEDFFASWAQMNYYQWSQTREFPTEFVIRVDAAWNSASDKANWFNSGCGFVYAEKGVHNHHLAYLGLDGYVYVGRIANDRFFGVGREYYGSLDVPEGSAEMMLVVEGGRVTYFVNGRKVLREADSTAVKGEIGLTLLSGTNKDYGTRCSMSNIDLWIIK